MIKKGANVSGIVLTTIFVIWVVVVGWNFFYQNAEQAGLTSNLSTYNSSINKIQDSEDDLRDFKDDMKELGDKVTEGNWLEAGYYGLVGVTAIFKAPFRLVGIAEDILSASSTMLAPIIGESTWTIIMLVITIIIVLAVITIITNRTREI